MQIKLEWLKGLSADEAAKKKLSVLSSRPIFEDLIEILKTKQEGLAKDTYDYDVPSWSHKQAHTNGYIQALSDVISLLTITERPWPMDLFNTQTTSTPDQVKFEDLVGEGRKYKTNDDLAKAKVHANKIVPKKFKK